MFNDIRDYNGIVIVISRHMVIIKHQIDTGN